jgi:hypothetical protein
LTQNNENTTAFWILSGIANRRTNVISTIVEPTLFEALTDTFTIRSTQSTLGFIDAAQLKLYFGKAMTLLPRAGNRHRNAMSYLARFTRRVYFRTSNDLQGQLLRWIGDERIIVAVAEKMRNPDLIHPNSRISAMRKIIWDA